MGRVQNKGGLDEKIKMKEVLWELIVKEGEGDVRSQSFKS